MIWFPRAEAVRRGKLTEVVSVWPVSPTPPYLGRFGCFLSKSHCSLLHSRSILGVRLFKGTFVGCDFSGLSTATVVAAMNEFGLSRETYAKPFRESDCLAAGGVWGATVDQNFDNVGSGLLSLFEISTTEGWVRELFVCQTPDSLDCVWGARSFPQTDAAHNPPKEGNCNLWLGSLNRIESDPRGPNVGAQENAFKSKSNAHARYTSVNVAGL